MTRLAPMRSVDSAGSELHKVALPRCRTTAKDSQTFAQIRLRPRCDREVAIAQSRYDYFFFFEVFFATFLVAAFVVFFAFLAMSSSAKKNGSVNTRASIYATSRRYHKCKIDTNSLRSRF
jgi:hypothetical protein